MRKLIFEYQILLENANLLIDLLLIVTFEMDIRILEIDANWGIQNFSTISTVLAMPHANSLSLTACE